MKEEKKKKEGFKQRLFSSDSTFSAILNKIADVVILHFMVLIFSIPIITIGAAVTAGDYVGMKLAGGMEGGVAGNFVKAFKENFKRSTLYFLMLSAIGAVLYISLRYWFMTASGIRILFEVITIALIFVWLITVLYIFAVQAKFENTFTATIKNSLLMAVRHFHITILMLIILAVCGYFAINFRPLQAIGTISIFGILLFIFGRLYNIVFRCYI